MTFLEVKKGLIAKMQEAFPKKEYKYYSKAVVENYERPCFFTQIITDSEPSNYNSEYVSGTLYIDCMQKTVDEIMMLGMVHKIRTLFGLYIKTDAGCIYIDKVSHDFNGSEKNVIQIQVDFHYMETIEHVNEAPLMESVFLNEEMEI